MEQKYYARVFKDGQEVGRIPFDAETVAQGVFRGFEIRPEASTPPHIVDQHTMEVEDAMKRIYKDKPLRTQDHTNIRPTPYDFSQGDTNAPLTRDLTIKNKQVTPNPFLKFNMPMFNGPSLPLTQEANFGGGLNDLGLWDLGLQKFKG